MSVTRFCRLLWRLAVLSVMLPAGVVAFVVAGYGSTWVLVSDGLDQFVGVERVAAQEALILGTVGCLDNPIVRAIVPRLRVVEVHADPACQTLSPRRRLLQVWEWEKCLPAGRDPECYAPHLPHENYRVHIQAYTFFRLPVRRIVVRCNGSSSC